MKRLLAILCTVCMLVGLMGLWGAAVAEEPYVFKFAHSMSEQSARHQSMLKFKELVEAKSNGRILVEIHPSGVLGSEAETMDMVAMNVIQGTAGSQFAKANPKYLIYQMPFMFESTDEFQAVLNSDFEKQIADGAIATGTRCHGALHAGIESGTGCDDVHDRGHGGGAAGQ